MALAPRLTSALARRGVPRPIAEVAALTVAATVATAPLLALHFGQVSLASVPANLAAAAAVAPIMWLGMLSGAVAQVDASLAVPLNLLNEPLLAYLQALAHAAAAVPFASVQVGPGLAVLGAALVAVGAAWLVARRAGRAMGPAVAVLAVGLLAAVVVLSGRDRASPDPRTLVVSFLDVGQGDATLLQRGGASVLFDTGPPGGPVVKRLRESGVTRLDALVITHAQLDHEGAAPAVIGAFEPRVILNAGAGWPTPVQRQLAADARTREVGAGRQVLIAGMTMRFLWPPPRGPGDHPDSDPNQRALVALVSAGEFDLLLPADAESDVTAALDLPRVEALKVAHHGSEDPGLPDLLSRLQPAVAAIEVGARNLYGHPRAQTLKALAAVPQVFRTDRDGTVRLHVTPAGIRVERD
jgi:competence protein ComEC